MRAHSTRLEDPRTRDGLLYEKYIQSHQVQSTLLIVTMFIFPLSLSLKSFSSSIPSNPLLTHSDRVRCITYRHNLSVSLISGFTGVLGKEVERNKILI